MLVLHSTGGLLYGKEVKRPAWLVPERRMRPRKLSRPTPAPRREELTRLLVGTKLSLREIAAEMGLKRATVQPWSSLIYRRHGVHSREALRRARPELMVAGRKMAG